MRDLRSCFRNSVWRAMPHSRGAIVGSDWADKTVGDPVFGPWKNCGFWTVKEVEILYNSVAAHSGGLWLDIGTHTGWTAAHIAEAGGTVIGIDPLFSRTEFRLRAETNLQACGFDERQVMLLLSETSDEFFAELSCAQLFRGIVIDGDHEVPHPLMDAQNAATRTKVILLHDAYIPAVQEAVAWLRSAGWGIVTHDTTHVVVEATLL